MNRFLRTLTVAALLLGLVGPLGMGTVFAQGTAAAPGTSSTTGNVQGSIKDNSGAPVADVKVTITGVETKSTTSDATGAFALTGLTAGVYTLTASKAGYQTANEPDLAVFAGQTQTLAITMPALTFQSLRTIASVRAAGRGTFNTTPASVNVIGSQTFIDQAEPQVMNVLNQTPGIVASLPSGSANGAVPGSITFPDIRGALSYETASLIDGHPVSVGTYGDYVTTFLNSFALGNVEIVKGPGADAPQVNYAIGGTVNFETKNPTPQLSGNYVLGYGSYGGAVLNFNLSDTIKRFGYVVDYARNYDPGPIDNYQAWFAPGGKSAYLNWSNASQSGAYVGYNDSPGAVPGTSSKLYNIFQLVGCCLPVNSTYDSASELVKMRYNLSDATTATVTYLGSQTTADQTGNTSSQLMGTFSPYSNYSGSLATGSTLPITNLYPGSDIENNNEPIFEGDVRTTIGNDTLLARYYHASIYRLIDQGTANPYTPDIFNLQLYGTNGGSASKSGPNVTGTHQVAFFDWFRQNEIDRLGGYSLEYHHPFGGSNVLTASANWDSSTTVSYYATPHLPFNGPYNAQTVGTSYSIRVPEGSKQNFSTYLLRALFGLGPKLNMTFSNYMNVYQSTYPTACTPVAGAKPDPSQCLPSGAGFTFASTTTSHYDPRLAFDYRANSNLALRFSAGSSIAPPYLNILSQLQGYSYRKGSPTATETLNAGNLKPETAFGYDLGGDYRFNDGDTVLSGDVYMTNLFNGFISQVYNSGTTCPDAVCGAGNSVPLLYSQYINLSNARYEGVELALRHTPGVGLGYTVQGAVQHAYAYNLGPCFYSTGTTCGTFDTNLGIVSGTNFTGGAENAFGGYGSFSNQSIPYLQGYAQLSYRTAGGVYAQVGETFLGKNNSLDVPPFGILGASLRVPIQNGLAIQVSGHNLTNALNGLFPMQGAGVPITLANGALGATQANVLGPRTVQVMLIKNFGAAAKTP